jgi:DNA-binding MarR family transcriptional regulator
MTGHPDNLAALDAWAALLHTERALQDRIEDDLKRAGLPPLDWYDVLQELEVSADGMLRQAALQKCTELAQYNVCRLIDRLERDGLVGRKSCPVDARNNVVVITEKGRTLRRQMQPVYAAAVDAHVGRHLSTEEAEQLRALLAKLKR